ncbi:MAG: flagellar basal body rod protein FlgB [Armatimonadia bacterium]|nr:flagellar basal body rod protein FlgB [Armatimonadia bacterium]
MEVTHGVADMTTRALEAALDCASTQHRVATNNLANIETPGYVARRASFEDQLQRAVRAEQAGRRGALASVQPKLSGTGDPAGPDGNNVSIEGEMLAIGEAAGRYQMLTRLLDRKLQMVGTAIGDGRS